VIDVSPVADEAEELLSLDAYNETWPHEAVDLAIVHSFKASLLDHADLLARIDGEAAGSGFALLHPARPDLVSTLVNVRAARRRRGVGTALYEAVSAWARERGFERLEAVVADDDPESLAFAERRGFEESRREPGLALDLTAIEPPPVEPPDGVEIVTWAERPELIRGIYEVAVEALPDIPGGEDERVEPFEDWLAHEMQGSGDRPEATFVAVADGEVVGYAKFSLRNVQRTSVHHDLTGVKRSWRGRGVARALKATQIVWAKKHGYDELRTRNDGRNEPIRRLNEAFGYRPAVGRIYLLGPLA
jgi:GNAT superfamily N-acetyltransferase